MTRPRAQILLLGLVCLVGLSACSDHDDDTATVPDQPLPCAAPTAPAPNLALTDLDGRLVDLHDLRCEAVILLDFWATWCGPCRDGLPLLQELHDTYADQGLLLLAVNLAEPEALVRSFLADAGYTFPVLLDPDNQAAATYEITSIPRQVIIDASGEVRFDRTGTHGIDDLDHHAIIPELLAELDR